MNQEILTGILLDEQTVISLEELCSVCSCSEEWVLELVDEGVLEPVATEQTQWQFSPVSLQRVHAATRLQRDLGINLEGVALVLDLLDDIELLESRLRQYESK